MSKFEEIIKKAKKVSLTSNEKSQIRENLFSFIKNSAVSKEVVGRQIGQRSIIFKYLKPMPILASLLITAMLGGGVAFAAENSLPGDLLYPVKVNVNEEVRASLALSAEAKAEWEAQRAERRLEEAEKLAQAGSLNVKTETQIESNFEKHTEKAKKEIAKLQTSADFRGAAEASSQLETSLRVHGKILKKLSQLNSHKREIDSVINKVEEETESASTTRAEIEMKISSESDSEVQEAAEGKLKAAENKIEEVRNFLEKIKLLEGEATTTISANTNNSFAEAEARLQLAENTVVDGKTKLAANSYGEAFTLFQKAQRIAQEAKLILSAREELNIDVGFNGENHGDEDKDKDVKIELKTKGRLNINL